MVPLGRVTVLFRIFMFFLLCHLRKINDSFDRIIFLIFGPLFLLIQPILYNICNEI